MRPLRHASLVALLGLSAACSADVIRHELGASDGGVTDVGPYDGSSGTLDAGVTLPDGGEPCMLVVAPVGLELVVAVGDLGARSFTLSNPCSVEHPLRSVTLTGAAELTLVRPEQLPTAVAPGATVSIEVRYDPVDVGTDHGVVQIESASPRAALDVPVTATGVPVEEPSRQNVTFRIHNASGADVYLVTSGWLCRALNPGVVTTFGLQCLCECGNPGGPGAYSYSRLAAGESYTMYWDARELALVGHPVDCAARGWPGAPPSTELVGSLRPAAPGPYVASVAYERTAPTRCLEVGPGQWECSAGTPREGMAPPLAELCPSTETASAEYVLAESGETFVDIELR
ncbi:hypothetical protein L6R52_15465 [Myxococcota bacterium]|nr:hypothetical protein [Myxococcota bacterium]